MTRIKNSAVLGLLLMFTFLFAACGGTSQAPPVRARAETSPTPEYKPPKRVSRDVIREEKAAPVQVKAKAE